MGTKFGANVSNRMLLNAAKFQSYSFYRSWVIKGKPTGGVKLSPPPPTQPPRLGLRHNNDPFITKDLRKEIMKRSILQNQNIYKSKS